MEILWVDDDIYDFRFMVQHIKEKYGHTIVTAENGQEALDIIKCDTQFDLLITDHNMPEMRGDELIRIVVNSGEYHGEILYLTNSISPEVFAVCKEFPDVVYMDK